MRELLAEAINKFELNEPEDMETVVEDPTTPLQGLEDFIHSVHTARSQTMDADDLATLDRMEQMGERISSNALILETLNPDARTAQNLMAENVVLKEQIKRLVKRAGGGRGAVQ